MFTSAWVRSGLSSGWVDAQTRFHSAVAMLGKVAALVIEAALVGLDWASWPACRMDFRKALTTAGCESI